MTSAFAILLSCVAIAAILAALIAFIWVNKTPRSGERFDEYGRVPLFGVEVGTGTATPLAFRPRSEELKTGESGDGGPIATVEDPSSAVNNGTLEGPALNGSRTPVSNGTIPSNLNGSPPNGSLPPRAGGAGWGATPGWPTPPSASVPISNRTGMPAQPATNGMGVNSNGVPGSMVEGHSIRFSVPVEGTLQFPGRLEISSGLDAGREIRFVRVPGPNGTEITFGRNEGPLYRHIQLRDQTVSREHARMTLTEGTWQLANLSRTNPVARNGRVLGYGEQHPLEDGDRVEMGEVVFKFRSR